MCGSEDFAWSLCEKNVMCVLQNQFTLTACEGTFTLARLGLAPRASVRLCLQWLVQHETVGGVKAVTQDDIDSHAALAATGSISTSILNFFLFNRHLKKHK